MNQIFSHFESVDMTNRYKLFRERIDNENFKVIFPERSFKPQLFGTQTRSELISLVDGVEYIEGPVLHQALGYVPRRYFGDVENREHLVVDINHMVNVGRLNPAFTPVVGFPDFDCRIDSLYLTVGSALHGAGIFDSCHLNLEAFAKMLPTYYFGNGCNWMFSDRTAWLLYDAVVSNEVIFSLLDPALNNVCHGTTV
jgi:hypothetical protein